MGTSKDTAMNPLSIGQVANATGVTVETLRFYEKERLLDPPSRTPAGYRQYPPETVKRVLFIQRAKEVGFTLKDITELLSLREQPGTTCSDIRLRASQKVEEVNRKLADLERIRNALVRMIGKCEGRGDLSECPILEELELE
jgi:MerR family mercuric resistance operon transcriptional regulator